MSLNQKKMDTFFVFDKIELSITADQFRTGIVTMVVKNGIPFKFFESDGFNIIAGEMAIKLRVVLSFFTFYIFILIKLNLNKRMLRQFSHFF